MSEETRNQLAVALHYDRTGAPRVIAKGKGTIGAKIIEVARAHDIPIEENEVLAGALSNVEIGDEIPTELYKAVAEVLIFVLGLSRPAPPNRNIGATGTAPVPRTPGSASAPRG